MIHNKMKSMYYIYIDESLDEKFKIETTHQNSHCHQKTQVLTNLQVKNICFYLAEQQ